MDQQTERAERVLPRLIVDERTMTWRLTPSLDHTASISKRARQALHKLIDYLIVSCSYSRHLISSPLVSPQQQQKHQAYQHTSPRWLICVVMLYCLA